MGWRALALLGGAATVLGAGAGVAGCSLTLFADECTTDGECSGGLVCRESLCVLPPIPEVGTKFPDAEGDAPPDPGDGPDAAEAELPGEDAAPDADGGPDADAETFDDVDAAGETEIDTGAPGLATGAACTLDEECGGPGEPLCLASYHPLEGLAIDSGDSDHDALWASLHLALPGGYCSTAGDCSEDADCGVGGGCFRPLGGLSEGELEALDELVPFDIEAFAARGVCLASCVDKSSCRADWVCAVPFATLIGMLPGASDRRFCVFPPDDPCAALACENGGSCALIAGGAGAECECPVGYKGDLCQTEIDECDPFPGTGISPCQNGSSCTDLVGDYECTCLPGYYGKSCEIALESCDPNPCQNGGTCQDSGDKVSCDCPEGWSGGICDQPD